MTGMLGVYLTAVELIKLDFIVSPTSRSAMGADLLVTDQHCKKAWSVQVKTNANAAGFWLTGEHARSLASGSHIYVFVNARRKKGTPEFYVVPSKIVAKGIKVSKKRSGKSYWYSFYRDDRYLNGWKKVFGNSSPE
jgi:hypothetical protein